MGNHRNDDDRARPAFYAAYRKVVDVPSEDRMVTCPTIAPDRDDRLLHVTRTAFARNGLITDATRTFAGHQTLNSSTTSVGHRANGVAGARRDASNAVGGMQ